MLIKKILVQRILEFLFGLILFNLGKALFSMLNERFSTRMTKALTWRVIFSLCVFAFLLLAFALGWIKPHGI